MAREEKISLESEIKKLSNLPQYKNKDKSIIEKIATRNLWLKQLAIDERFDKAEDKKLATKLLTGYLENFDVANYNDASNIADLCFKEVLKIRTQERISKIFGDEKNNLIPEKQITCLHDLEQDILMLKEKTGISVTKDKDSLNALQELEKRYAVYIPFHRNEFETEWPTTCPKCKYEYVEMHLLRRRCNKDNFEHLKHPAFSGRFLYNKEIFKDLREGKITIEQAARFQRTSEAYCLWVLENEFKIIDIEDVKKEDIDNFVNNNPFLPNAEEYNKSNEKNTG